MNHLTDTQLAETLRNLKDAGFILLDTPIACAYIQDRDIIVEHISCAVQYYGAARYAETRKSGGCDETSHYKGY